MNPFLFHLLTNLARKRLEDKQLKESISSKEVLPLVQNLQVELKHEVKNYLYILIGVFSAGFGLKGFLLPNQFIDGGATGVQVGSAFAFTEESGFE